MFLKVSSQHCHYSDASTCSVSINRDTCRLLYGNHLLAYHWGSQHLAVQHVDRLSVNAWDGTPSFIR